MAEGYQEIINEFLDEQINLSLYKHTEESAMVKNTVGIKCRHCGSENVFVYSKQTRSADEATTKFYTCLDCGNKWSVN